MVDQGLAILANLIQGNLWLAPLLVLLAGFLTSLTPCSLSTLPLILGYVNYITDTEENNRFKVLKVTSVFVLGQAFTFTLLGTAATLLGKLMRPTGTWWYLILGIMMVLMSLQVVGILNIVKPIQQKGNKKGYLGAFLTGVLGGVFASPCATPVLVVLLGLISRSNNMILGIGLMLLYALGVNILVFIAGLSTGFVNKVITTGGYGNFTVVLKYVMGLVMLVLGCYMLYKGM